jgi:nucleoside-diphosphate-sugar epimerase
LDACAKYGAKLVFFDNVYMYTEDTIGKMTEENKIGPIRWVQSFEMPADQRLTLISIFSRKGKVRAKVAQMIMEDVKSGKVKALIARAPDFLGEKNSAITIMAVEPLATGKSANWMGDLSKIHNYIYVADAGRATALLGNTEDAFGQVWHLPTDSTKYTGKQWVDMVAKACGVQPKVSGMERWMLTPVGWFVPFLGGFRERSFGF